MHCDEIWHKKTQQVLTLWFKHRQCLTCRMLLLQEGMDWSVQLKTDISMNLQFIKVTQSLQQNEGHLPLVSYCTSQRNKHMYSFLSSPSDCKWTRSPQHTDKKPAPLRNLNTVRLQPKQSLRIYDEVYIQLQIVQHRVSTYSRSYLKGINLERENWSEK
jgi:hypothetical protein